MNATITVQGGTRTSANDTDGQTRCDACDHDLLDHDSISRRYCNATQAQALSRRCICPNHD